MTTTEQRQILRPLIEQAMQDGARLHRACAQIGLSGRTVQRWSQSCALAGDCRLGALRANVSPPNKLS
jgi:putative transposase